MMIEVCDLCKKPVNDLNKTEVIIKDYKGVRYGSFGLGAYPEKRKIKGVICDDCLDKLKGDKIECYSNVVHTMSQIPPKKD